MSRMKFEQSHSLSKEEVTRRVTMLLGYWASKYGVTSEWAGDSVRLSGKVMGITLEARLEVSASKVMGDATDPGFLLRDRARKYLQQKFASYLDPAWSGQAGDD